VDAIDIHTHAFPDELAERAIRTLESESPVKARLDGTLSALLVSMDRAGIAVSVIASIATKPQQADAILAWSLRIASPRIVPFASVHPEDRRAADRLAEIASSGIRGIKLHPYYQRFEIDEERMAPIYGEAERLGLVVLMHAGFDIGFPRDRIADPARIARVASRFPGLKIVAAHLGGWCDWDEVERRLIGRPIRLDLATCAAYMPPQQLTRFLQRHPADCLVFGSDSPWEDQAESLDAVRRLCPQDRLPAILRGNAERLLGL
jgi:uncharacterized protein